MTEQQANRGKRNRVHSLQVLVNDLGGSLGGEGASQRAADAVVAEIRQAGGTALANYDSVLQGEKIISAALEHFGQVDILINNAGILRDGSFSKMSKEQWSAVLDVHVQGAFRTTRAVWNHMRERRYGRILFVTSAAGLYGNFGQGNYAAAKLALVGLTNVLALEGARRGVQVNCAAPIAASRMTATVLPQDMLQALQPAYVAPAAAFLVHEQCTETGGVFEMGAGWMAKLRQERGKGVFYPVSAAATPVDAASSGGGAPPPTPPSAALHVWEQFSPDALAADWKRVMDWGAADHPTSNQEVFGVLMEHFDQAAAAAAASSTAPAGAPGGSTFASSEMFKRMAAAVAADPAAAHASLKAAVRFCVSDSAGVPAYWLLDATSAAAQVTFEGNTPGDTAAQLTVSAPDSVLASVGAGELTPQQAFMRGKLKLKGNMALAGKLGGVLAAGAGGGAAGKL